MAVHPSISSRETRTADAKRPGARHWLLLSLTLGVACGGPSDDPTIDGVAEAATPGQANGPSDSATSPVDPAGNPAMAPGGPSFAEQVPSGAPGEPVAQPGVGSQQPVGSPSDPLPQPGVSPADPVDVAPGDPAIDPTPADPVAPIGEPTPNVQVRPEGWTPETHERREPDYAAVFPAATVNTVTIRVAPEHWAEMLDFMTEHWGPRGAGGGFGGGGIGGGGFGGGGFGGGGFGGGDGNLRFVEETPVWVPADIEMNGVRWHKVGIRFKGNSSLSNAWSSNTDRFPFRINTDKFEDDYPETKNQRIYGFKKLSLNTSWNDATFGMRERITYQIFRDAGLVVSEAASYHVQLDRGEGPTNLGIYTFVEIVDDTVVSRYFGSDSGNIYKPDGGAANLSANSFSGIPEGFVKQNNEDAADWSDVERLHQALHSSMRTSNPEAWRAGLEAVFDVDSFLRFLGLGALVQHGDTYGAMAHNYYFYTDPVDQRMHFISWDHDLTFGAGNFFSAPLSKASVSANDWPLIRFLWDDPVYRARYIEHLRDVRDNFFTPATYEARYREWAPLFRPHVTGNASSFDDAVNSLITATNGRLTELNNFLAQQ